MTSTTIDEMIAPITEITMKSTREIVGVVNSAPETALASTASTAEIESESRIAALTFWPKSVSTRRETRNVPAWIWVPRRLPSPPKMLPRIPMAAGISTNSPGSWVSVPVIEASVRPVTRSPPDEIRSAKKPARTPAKSERSSATKRATARRGNRSIGNSAGQT